MPDSGLVIGESICEGLQAAGSCVQFIHPKLANTVQKPPRTTSHACKPPSGGGLGAGSVRFA
jgi:hypothetical protein